MPDVTAGTAILFPGMGPTRFADTARFMMVNPVARRLVSVADDVLGYPLLRRWRVSEGDYSEPAQVAFLVSCVALARWAREALGIEPVAVAGPSFGAKAATAFTDSLPFTDAVSMTARLARCVEEYFGRHHRDVVTQSFARVPSAQLAEGLAELADRGEWYDISCHIDDEFHMLSVRQHNLEWLRARLARAGGLPLYTMRPPMHSAAFDGLRRAADEQVLGSLTFADPTLPVIADHGGAVIRTADGMRTMLLDQFVRPVRWPDVVASMRRLGVARLAVCGQDSLFGRVPITRRNFEVVGVDPAAAMRPRHTTPPAGQPRA